MSTVKYLGTSDDFTTCECCGRKNLKSTVALSIGDQDPVYFGSDCAARAIGRSSAEVKRETKRADDAKYAAEKARRDAEHASFMKRWTAFLLATAPAGDDVFTRINALGGMKRARELFNASPFAKEDLK